MPARKFDDLFGKKPDEKKLARKPFVEAKVKSIFEEARRATALEALSAQEKVADAYDKIDTFGPEGIKSIVSARDICQRAAESIKIIESEYKDLFGEAMPVLPKA